MNVTDMVVMLGHSDDSFARARVKMSSADCGTSPLQQQATNDSRAAVILLYSHTPVGVEIVPRCGPLRTLPEHRVRLSAAGLHPILRHIIDFNESI